MARTAVQVVDFEDGALPRICASSGDEARRRADRQGRLWSTEAASARTDRSDRSAADR